MEQKEVGTIYEMLWRSARQYGAVTALRFDSGEISYAELWDLVRKRAVKYQKDGLTGRYVDLEPILSKDWLITFLALLSAGVIVVIHEPQMPDSVMDHLCLYSKITEDRFRPDLPIGKDENEEPDPPSQEDPAVVIFTSGTTGEPKGVVLTHKNIVSDVIHSLALVGPDCVRPGDTTIPVLPVFHMFSITVGLLAPLYAGVTLCFLEDTKYFIRKMCVYRPKLIFIVPMIAKTLLAVLKRETRQQETNIADLAAKITGGKLEQIICGGAPLGDDLIREMEFAGLRLMNGYGITECSPVVCTSSPEQNRKGSVGRVNQTPYCRVKICEGEIAVKGDIVMKGYSNFPDAKDSDGWFYTGDRGWIDEDGYLFVTGRKKNLIILDDGNNISPEELESRLEEMPIVQDAFVYAEEGKNMRYLSAKLYPMPEVRKIYTEEELEKKIEEGIHKINEELPAYKQIQSWSIQKEPFPKTGLGKVIRGEVEI